MENQPASVPDLITSVLSQVDTWPRAAVVVTAIAAFVLLRWLNKTKSDVKDIKETLTSNNGGSHIKDSMDAQTRALERIEASMGELAGRVETLETAAAAVKSARGFFGFRLKR